jgi:hypothetical protein
MLMREGPAAESCTPIRPGEDECAAALRLLGRLRRVLDPRFVAAVTIDGWYARGPLLRCVEELGWDWIVVLKREDMDVYQEAHRLSQGQKQCAAFDDAERKRHVQLPEVKHLDFSEGYARKVRVVRSEERWVERQVRRGQLRRQARASHWVWAASAGLDGYAARLIYQGGHRRWGIENKAFNEPTQAYHLNHCYHHEPTSMPAQMLILLLGFLLFSAFAQLHSKVLGLGKMTGQALAQDLNLALQEDLPWQLWFASG